MWIVTMPALLAWILLIACPVYAQGEYKYSKDSRYKGYTKDVGDRTEGYTPWGDETGYSRTIGDREYDFTPDGREKGYSQTFGDITYEKGEKGRVKGYKIKVEDQASESAGGAVSGADAARTFNSGAGSGIWGFSGPPSAAGEKGKDD